MPCLHALFGILIAALALPPPAAAQVVAPGYVHDAWTNADGLPVNTVNALAQDRDGYLWLATFDGLIRFDGHAFTVYNTANTPGLTSNRIAQVALDPDGRLWFSAIDGTVGYRADDRFTFLDRDVYGRGRVVALAPSPDGTLWVNTARGIYRAVGDSLHNVWHDDGLALNAPVYPLRDGTFWVATFHTSDAALYVTPAGVTRFPADRYGEVYRVYEDPRAPGVVWVSTSRGTYRYDAGTATGAWATTLQTPHTLFRDTAGQLHLGTFNALYRLDGSALTPVMEADRGADLAHIYWEALPAGRGSQWVAGPRRLLHDGRVVFGLEGPQTQIRQVLLDREGNLWIATLREGLHRLRPSLFTTYSTPEGLSPNVYALREGTAGTIWVGSQGGGIARLRVADGLVWQPTGALSTLIYDVLLDRSGGITAAGDGVWRSASAEDPVFEDLAGPLGIPRAQARARALYEDRSGCLWIGTIAGVWRRCGTRTDHYTRADGLPSDFVRAFLETRDGTLWMATVGGGLAAFRDDAFHTLDARDGLSSNTIRALYQDDEGALWVGTEDQGLNRILLRTDDPTCPAHVTIYRASDGLFADGIHVILEDDDRRFWMSTNRGIFWVTRDGLADFADGHSRRIFSVGYDESDGLRDREANGGTQSPGIKTRDGRLWFATQEGAVVIDPAEVRPEVTAAIPTYVETVRAGSLAVATQGALRLPQGVRDFDVHYTGIHFTKPQSVRYRYRLDGGTEAAPWVEAGDRRAAIFTNVAPGAYTFEVVASAYPGLWPERGATLALTVPPYAYETAWFKALAVLLLAAALAGLYGWRVGHHRRHAAHLNALVQARTAEVRLEQARTEDALHAEEEARTDAEAQRQEAIRLRRIAEDALRQVQQQAEKLRTLDAAKSRFFANISHEFRTPLTLTLGPLEDLQDGAFGQLDADALAQVQLAHHNARRLLRLINQLLDLSRLESGTIQLRREPVDLRAVLHGIVEAFAALAERKGLTFTLDVPDAPVYAEGDAERLDEVFVNLIGNAFKFTPDGGRIVVRLEGEGETGRVVVADTGTGIDPEDLPHVFERFYQGRRGQHPARPGTGIGLALSQELVQLHGGTLTAASTPGAGSTFTVTLPALAPEAVDAAAVTPPAGHRTADAAGTDPALPADEVPEPEADDERTCVLVVDDHPDIRAYVRRHLEPAYRVLEAADGAQGLGAAREHLPDLVVSDVMMPEMDGYDLLRALKQDPQTAYLPVILLTGRAAAEDKLAGLGEGADDYLTKPFDVKELRARVDNLIAQRRRLRDLLRRTPDGATTPGPDPDAPPTADEAFVARVRGVVLDHLADESLNVEILADEVGLSRTQLYRRLKAVTGQTPTAFLRSVRLAVTSAGLDGRFRLRWPEWMDIPDDWQIHLHDLSTGAVTDLRAVDHYAFDAQSTTPAAKQRASNLAPPPLRPQSVARVRFRLTVAPGGTATGREAPEVPSEVELQPSYPNPFNPSTRIGYSVPAAGRVRLVVYDVLGREVDVLVDGVRAAGRYEAVWDAGTRPSGTYVYRLDTAGRRLTGTMLLVK